MKITLLILFFLILTFSCSLNQKRNLSSQETIKKSYPHDLQIGESTRVDFEANESPTFVKFKYLLTRVNEGHYEMQFNLDFMPDIDYEDDEYTRAEIMVRPSLRGNEIYGKVRTQYRKLVNSCFEQINPYLRGPSDESLSFKLYQRKPQDKIWPPAIRILVKGKNKRSNSKSYEQNIQCDVILHEILHLAGLVDEYREKWIRRETFLFGLLEGYIQDLHAKDRSALDCRSVAPKNSIMSHQYLAFLDVFESKESTTLLKPAHFLMITRPFNKKLNETYIQCAANAYKTSKKNNGTGCLPSPPICSTEKWLEAP